MNIDHKKLILSFFKKKKIDPRANLFEFGVLDSLSVLDLIAFLEKKLKKKIPHSKIKMQNFYTLDMIEKTLKKIK